ncbi:MAG TPA: ABC transporter ATP-binding protein [Anaerolineae bacterium]|nr:ABC transporter ATP-binding protein [Caldilineae bacterium]HID33848.1 ABC transporter ATP-binding protein [Anaerolineae bacterium]HIQ11926.1 ABC transporter ATP-binding protein [Caldilineales bacterium]
MLLTLDHVSKAFGDPADPLHALQDISFQVRRGAFVCLVGPSGSGKSTLLKLIAGLLRPTSGQIRLDEQPIRGPSPRVGIVFQTSNLMPWRTVLDNVALPLELRGVPRAARYDAARKQIALVALDGFERHYPHQLSGGMRQRAAIARTLVQNPELMLLDEPFGALDALTREYLNQELLRIHRAEEVTILMVTHAIHEAVWLADRVLVLSQRPGVLKADIPIPLPRPRTEAMFIDSAYLTLVKQVRSYIDRPSVASISAT